MKKIALFSWLILLTIVISGCAGPQIVNDKKNDNKNVEAGNDCEIGKEYKRDAVKPVLCKCPSGYEFKIVSMGWGACPKAGMSDCPVATVKCVAVARENQNTNDVIAEEPKVQPEEIHYLKFGKWQDESSGPGLLSGKEDQSVFNNKDILLMNSMDGGNYYMEKSYYISAADLKADFNYNLIWSWQQTEIARPYGAVYFSIAFYSSDGHTTRQTDANNLLGHYHYMRHTGDFEQYNCPRMYKESTLGPKQFICHDEPGTLFEWQTKTVNLKELLDTDLSGVDKTKIKTVKIRITSYNNAGAGAVTEWADFKLIRAE